jgi:hypothetical protein
MKKRMMDGEGGTVRGDKTSMQARFKVDEHAQTTNQGFFPDLPGTLTLEISLQRLNQN